MGLFSSIISEAKKTISAISTSIVEQAKAFPNLPKKPGEEVESINIPTGGGAIKAASTVVANIVTGLKTAATAGVITAGGAAVYGFVKENPKQAAQLPGKTLSFAADLGAFAANPSKETGKELITTHPVASGITAAGLISVVGLKGASIISNVMNTQAIKENTQKAATLINQGAYSPAPISTNKDAVELAKIAAENNLALAKEQTKQAELAAKAAGVANAPITSQISSEQPSQLAATPSGVSKTAKKKKKNSGRRKKKAKKKTKPKKKAAPKKKKKATKKKKAKKKKAKR